MPPRIAPRLAGPVGLVPGLSQSLAAPMPHDVRGGRGGTGMRGIDGAERAVAEEGAVEVGRWRQAVIYLFILWGEVGEVGLLPIPTMKATGRFLTSSRDFLHRACKKSRNLVKRSN